MLPVTPQPHEWLGVCVSIAAASCFSLVSLVISGSPEDRTRHNLVISKAWTTSPRLPCVRFANADSVGAYLPCQWAGRRSNPRLRFFRPPLDRLSYQPIKKPDVACDTGFLNPQRLRSSVTSANEARAYSPVDRRNYLRTFVRI